MPSISLPALALGATALSAGGTIMSGMAQNNQAKAEAAQYDQNAKNAMTAADQADEARRSDLMSTLSSINAVRAARGLDVASPTGVAITDNTTQRAETAINTQRLNYEQESQSDKTAAGIRRSQGSAALIGGFLKGGQSLFGGVSDYMKYG